jgi:hypothetical protein
MPIYMPIRSRSPGVWLGAERPSSPMDEPPGCDEPMCTRVAATRVHFSRGGEYTSYQAHKAEIDRIISENERAIAG